MTSNTAYPTTVPTRTSEVLETSGSTDLPDLGTVLGVWAHPDDEAYLSAGLVQHARAAGHRVVVVTATDGELEGPRTPPARGAVWRAPADGELAASLRVLGVDEHRRLGYADGGCASVDRAAAVDRVAAVIEDVRPDTIVTFGPDGFTGHLDHQAVGAWTVRAAALAGHRGRLWFPTLTPEFHRRWSVLNDRAGLWMDAACVPVTPADLVTATVHLSGERLERKVAALAAQASQTAGLVDLAGEETYAQWWSTEWFRQATPAELAPERSSWRGLRVHA